MKKLSLILIGTCIFSFGTIVSAMGYEDVLAIHPDTTVLYMKSNITQGGVTGFDCFNPADGASAPCLNADGTPWVGVGFPANPATIHWGYSGDVYAANVDDDSGVQKRKLGTRIGTVTGAPSFPATFGLLAGDPLGSFGPGEPLSVVNHDWVKSETLPWTCTGCKLEISGSTFERVANMPLTGRAFIGLGAVDNTEGYLALRMGGCAGIQETSGVGKYANMMGTICLNGTIGFNMDFTGVGTSNCVMVLQKGPYAAVLN